MLGNHTPEYRTIFNMCRLITQSRATRTEELKANLITAISREIPPPTPRS